MASTDHTDVANLLLRKAASHLSAARTLAAEHHSDDPVGFHVHQAVENALRAALAFAELDVTRTHDLASLVERLVEHGIDPPEPVAHAEWLNPWAVTARYEDIDDTLDRDRAIQLATFAVEWARSTTSKRRRPSPSRSGAAKRPSDARRAQL